MYFLMILMMDLLFVAFHIAFGSFKPFLEMDSAYVDYHVRDDRNANDTVVYRFWGVWETHLLRHFLLWKWIFDSWIWDRIMG